MINDDPRDRRISELEAKLALALATIEQLVAENKALKARVAELEARLNQNSHNSSKPPSSDGPGAEPRHRGRSGRNRGGQEGHQKYESQVLPPTRTVTVQPKRCRKCSGELSFQPAASDTHRVIDLPQIRPEVTQYHLFHGWCQDCGCLTKGELPDGVPLGEYGPGVMALTALLTGRYHLSKRDVPELMGDVFGIPMSTGTVCNLEQRVSEALAFSYEQAKAFVQEQPKKNADETGMRENKGKAWLWVMLGGLVAVFQVAKSRGSEVARDLLGPTPGIVTSDRFGAYAWLEVTLRQLCWAHLLRDFEGMSERGGRGRVIGKELVKRTEAMFRLWYRVRDGTLSPRAFQRKMKSRRRKIEALLREASVCDDATTQGKARDILKYAPAMWTFVEHRGIEPTNNAAERALRQAVLWRKGSFGTDSDRGSRFMERIWTATTSLRMQKRNVLSFLTEACQASLRGDSAPSLLPA